MNNLSYSSPTIFLPNKIQQTDSHCGPAVLQSLLGNLGKSVTQDQIVEAAGNQDSIGEEGTRPYQLANAVSQLAPNLQFWFKQYSSRNDLYLLIKKYHTPVAVNWQGLFYDTDEEQEINNPEGEHGHYSIVLDVDPLRDEIVLADPYADYAYAPRIFSLNWFEQRWWDEVDDIDPYSDKKIITRTYHFMFVIASKDALFPQQLGLQLPNRLHLLSSYEL